MFRSMPSKMRQCFCTVQSLFLLFLFPAVSLAVSGADRTAPEEQAVMKKLAGISVPFVENRGQVGDDRVRYYARTFGGTLFVTESGEMVYSLPYREKSERRDRDASRWVDERAKVNKARGVSLRETLVGASVETIRGQGLSPSKVSYFRGNDRSRWQSGLVTYNTVSLGEVYPGIELALKAYGNNVEKLFTVKPHTDPGVIRMRIEGAKSICITTNDEMEAMTDLGPVHFTKPVAFQEIGGKRVDVPVQYALAQGTSDYAFAVSEYDRVIDPLLASTFLGGSSRDLAQGIASDASGNVYVVGFTDVAGFPTTTGAYDESWNGNSDAFISKLSSDLTQLLASTLIGGSDDDEAQAITLDASGNVYLAGVTYSADFPVTAGAYQTTKKDSSSVLSEAFIAKLNGDLTQLLASTFLGGSSTKGVVKTYYGDLAYAITLDTSGNIYVAGITDSTDFPTTTGSYRESKNGGGTDYDDVFISKLNGNLTQLLASTYLGGSGHDRARTIALDNSGNIYVAGFTYSANFPTTGGVYDTAGHVSVTHSDAFIAKLNGNLTQLLASTYLGGSMSEVISSMALDASGNIYLAGFTYSTDFPTTTGAYDTSSNGNQDGFVSKMSGDMKQLTASTFLGGSGNDSVNSLALDAPGNVYLAGYTGSINYPTTSRAYDTALYNSIDAFISKFNGDLTRLLSSTFLGGSAEDQASAIVVDAARNVYVTGWTQSTTFPTTVGAYDRSYQGGYDVFVSKFDSTLRRLDPKGDVDGNDIVDLADAILAIQVLSGVSTAAGKVTLDADVNINDRIDLAEVIYILQKVAKMRQ
jgi:hypothetical protein